MRTRILTPTENVAVELNEAWPHMLNDGLQTQVAAVAVQEVADQIEHVWGEYADQDLIEAARKIAGWLRLGAKA